MPDNNKEEKQDSRPGWARWMNLILWVFVPLLALTCAECAARRVAPAWIWYSGAERKVAAGPIRALFLGSSRVAAAIDIPAFEKYASEKTGSEFRAVNLGYGASTLMEHYLGIRNLWESYPKNLRDCAVFLEAPMGLPPYTTPKEPWVVEGYSELILPLLRAKDVPAFLKSNTPSEIKAQIAVDHSLYRSKLWIYRRTWRGQIILGVRTVLSNLRRPSGAVKPQETKSDLAAAGGIPIDEEFVKMAREQAVLQKEKGLTNQQPIRNWDQRLMGQIVNFVKAGGGEVVFYIMPLSSLQTEAYNTETRKNDILYFADQAKQWGTPIIYTDFRYNDEDFPDLWHLRKSRMPEFSSLLAKSWLENRH